MRVSLLVFLSLLVFATPGYGNVVSQAMQSATAEEAVEVATKEVFDLISAGEAYVEEDPERFYGEVHALLDPMIDFKRFARGVMGVWYKKATPEQFERLIRPTWSPLRWHNAHIT